MEGILSVGQAVIIWSVVFAPCLAVVLAAAKLGAEAPDEYSRPM